MQRNNRLSIARHKLRKAVHILFFLLWCCLLTAFFGCGAVSVIKAPFEMVGFTQGMMGQLKERETSLIESAEKPLTESQEELLTQLLEEKDGLDAVLSSQPYLTYLEEQIGAVHEDYPTYLAAVPTTEQKSTILFTFKGILPPETTDEQIQICMDFYFQFCELIVNEPESEEVEAFIKEHLVRPLMDTYSSKMSASDTTEAMKITVVPSGMAPLDTNAFRKVWLKQLEVYGSREGLLRCAISNPDEFALIRSFFEDAASLERWIRLPPK